MSFRSTPASELRWEPWPDGEPSVLHVLRSWEETPYRADQRVKGRGVDCVRFVCAVMDELLGELRSSNVSWPQDGALHDPIGAVRTMRTFLKTYQPHFAVRDGTCQPGDVLVCGAENGGPGHAMIVGQRGAIWHADKPTVCYMGFDHTIKVFRVLRSPERDRWIKG